MQLPTFISIILLITAPIVGLLLYKLTKDEKDLIAYYFPLLLWTSAIAAAIFLTLNITYALILIYFFITLFTWFKLSNSTR